MANDAFNSIWISDDHEFETHDTSDIVSSFLPHYQTTVYLSLVLNYWPSICSTVPKFLTNESAQSLHTPSYILYIPNKLHFNCFLISWMLPFFSQGKFLMGKCGFMNQQCWVSCLHCKRFTRPTITWKTYLYPRFVLNHYTKGL
jgi:hypothetical protein